MINLSHKIIKVKYLNEYNILKHKSALIKHKKIIVDKNHKLN